MLKSQQKAIKLALHDDHPMPSSSYGEMSEGSSASRDSGTEPVPSSSASSQAPKKTATVDDINPALP